MMKMAFENYKISINLVFQKKTNFWAPSAHLYQTCFCDKRGQNLSLIDMSYEIKQTLLSMTLTQNFV